MCKIIGIIGGDYESQHNLKESLLTLFKDAKYKVDASPYPDAVNTNQDFFIVYTSNSKALLDIQSNHVVDIVKFSDVDIGNFNAFKNRVIYTIDDFDSEYDAENIFDLVV